MQEITPSGEEYLSTGSLKELQEKKREALERGSKAEIFSEGQSFRLKSGQIATVTKNGLRLKEQKKRACNRKKNKAARAARRKQRR